MTEQKIREYLEMMVLYTENKGYPIGYTRRFYDAGEWLLCFEELLWYAGEFSEFENRWSAELRAIREEYLEYL